MAICTFFGHKDTPGYVEPILRSVLIDLIENRKVDMFFAGNQGNFDYMVRNNLRSLKFEYSHVNYAVVLAYMPSERNDLHMDCSDTVFPEGLESVLPRYAIARRNRWMLDRADYVVTYVTHRGGGAAQFMLLAQKKGKTVINLADLQTTAKYSAVT